MIAETGQTFDLGDSGAGLASADIAEPMVGPHPGAALDVRWRRVHRALHGGV